MKTALPLIATLTVVSIVTAQIASQSADQKPLPQQVSTADVKWGPLNPARGNKGPKAGTLWSDRTSSKPSGFLVQFVDGFSSPPHIHNVTYRGVVISGQIHNDDPNAKEMWMPAGSFWTQPAGEVHITAAKGEKVLAYIEIDSGPYLVLPQSKAFDKGERPVNVDTSNIVWLDAANTHWIDQSSSGKSKIAFLWGSPKKGQLSGSFIKLPAGFSGSIRSDGSTFHAVVIKGQPKYQLDGETDVKTLEPGNYFGSTKEVMHQVSCNSGGECIIYVRTNGSLKITQSSKKE